jgi:glycosyltransferase involved in cell wall biosynthesis
MELALISTESLITPPQKYGGIESVVFDLAKGLTEKGIDVCLFACNGSHSPSGRLVEVIEQGWGKTGQCEEFERKMLDMGKYLKSFDVIHDNSHQKPSWKIHPRVINTMHWMQNPAQCNYTNVVAISRTLREQILPWNKGKEIQVVHNGCDLSKYEFKENKSERFLFLSAMSPGKGADVALKVAMDMGLPMDFAGLGGSAAGEIEKAAKSNPELIGYCGEVTEEEKISLYQNARALIFPTGVHGDWKEPFGLVAIEAMACGTPVITWNSGAMPEIVQDGKTGYICNSIQELTQAINHVDRINHRECRRHVEENFTYQAMAEKYILLYNQVLNSESW